MSSAAPLTDTAALTAHRTRAKRLDSPALFLQRAAADDIQERLDFVNRTFNAPAIVTPFPEIWADRIPGARLVADTDTLDLSAGAHDLVIHALSLHWANDPVGQLIQCRRALRPDGLFLGTLFGGATLSELRACLAEAESALTGGLSPRVAPMAELREIGGLLQRAGFSLPVADSATSMVTYDTALHLMRDLRAMGETNALAARHKTTPPRVLFADAARRYAEHFAGPDGRIRASFEIVVLTGWAPDASQPQPLRPGSAKARLADALGSFEVPLGDESGRSD